MLCVQSQSVSNLRPATHPEIRAGIRWACVLFLFFVFPNIAYFFFFLKTWHKRLFTMREALDSVGCLTPNGTGAFGDHLRLASPHTWPPKAKNDG